MTKRESIADGEIKSHIDLIWRDAEQVMKELKTLVAATDRCIQDKYAFPLYLGDLRDCVGTLRSLAAAFNTLKQVQQEVDWRRRFAKPQPKKTPLTKKARRA